MDINKRKKLLENLWYVDENLKLTDDPTKSVGFIDLVFGAGTYSYYFIITFFERIGVAKSSIDARTLIEQWLKRKYATHRLATRNTTFEPVIPLATSVAFCNANSAQHGRENSALHGRKMEYCWVLLPFEGKIHIDDVNYRTDTAIPIKDAGKFEETDSGAMESGHKFVYDVNEAFNVFPAVLVDYNYFPFYCQSVDLFDHKLYSNTNFLYWYNENKYREYSRKLRSPSVISVHIEPGDFGVDAGAIEDFLDGF